MAFANSATGKLVEIQTADGLRLHGFFQQSGALAVHPNLVHQSKSDPKRECWLIVHGVAGNFYNSSLLSAVASTLLNNGMDVLRMNTRGRDAMAYFAVGSAYSRCGAAYETIADGVTDIAAWVQAAQREGYEAINLLGHSLGAVKSLLYASQCDAGALAGVQHQGLSRLVLLSPPRLQYNTLKNDSKYAVAYAENLTDARKLCDSGKPEALITIRYPQPMIVSAGTYLDKYGPASLYDYHSLMSKTACPTLWVFGEHEVRGPRASFRDADKILHEAFQPTLGLTQEIKVVSGGDHAYTGVRDLLCESVIDWTNATVQ